MDGWTLHAGVMHPEGRPAMYFGMCYRGEQGTPIASFDAPTLADLEVPGPLPCTVTLADGTEIGFTAEQVHALPMTLTQDNDNINGIDWDAPDGYGHFERSARLDTLKRPNG
jgi:hypothetical protein